MVEGSQSKSRKAGNSTIAWFRLAELVSRGEKEKALNLYRLLAHSFDDRAYVLQLEGDILASFDDKSAIDCYVHSAFLYKKEQKLVAAVAVYEHLLTLQPSNYDYLHNALEVYAALDWREKLKERFRVLLGLLENGVISRVQVGVTVKKILTILSSKRSVADFVAFIEGEASFFVKESQRG